MARPVPVDFLGKTGIKGLIEDVYEEWFHCWAAVAVQHLTLSCMIVHGNTNGTMSLHFYRDQKVEILFWRKMVIAGMARQKSRNILLIWKKKNKLEGFFNFAPSSRSFHIWKAAGKLPNNPWQKVKYPHWNDLITKELIAEGWVQVYQEFTRGVD